MNSFWFKALVASPVAVAASLLFRLPALAGTVPPPVVPISQIATADSGQLTAQVTSVSQLSDVQPTDWAFQALQSLVERYGCIAGYPNGTFRGNRAMTRYEFAAGLNACLNKMNELIEAGDNQVRQEDLAALQKLEDEFGPELAALRGRVDSLEARTAKLEAQQFSTTTKLSGEVVFALAGAFGNTIAVNSGKPASTTGIPNNLIFGDRVRLNFVTSFNGRDQLLTRLEANDFSPFSGSVTGTNETRLGFDGIPAGTAPNGVIVGRLWYATPIGDHFKLWAIATGGEFNDVFYNYNPYFQDGGTGALSRFGRFSSIYRFDGTGSGSGTGGTGFAFTYRFNRHAAFDAGYMAKNAEFSSSTGAPTTSFSLFGSTYEALAQIDVTPVKKFQFGLTYAHTYFQGGDVSVTSATGTNFAAVPFPTTAGGSVGQPSSSDAYGLEFNWSPVRHFNLSGWVDYTTVVAQKGTAGLFPTGAHANLITWAAALAFPDLGRRGNVGGIIFGQPGTLEASTYGAQVDSANTYQLEMLYKYRVTDNIFFTPGAFVIFNPNGNSANSDIYVAAVRTTFHF